MPDLVVLEPPLRQINVARELNVREALPPVTPTAYLPQLDGTRALCLLYVFSTHAYFFLHSPTTPPSIVDRFFSWGPLGMQMFFVLSGYLITSLLLSEKDTCGSINLKFFYIRRVLRTWPLYLVALSVAFIIMPALSWTRMNTTDYANLLKTELLPFCFFMGNYSMSFWSDSLATFSHAVKQPICLVLFPLWSICVEEQFYAIWPVVVSRISRERTLVLKIIGLTFASIACRFFLQQYSLSFSGRHSAFYIWYYNTASYVDAIMLGSLVSLIALRKPHWLRSFAKRGSVWATLLLGCFCFIVTYVPSTFKNHPSIVVAFFVTALGSALLLSLVLAWNPLRNFLSQKILVTTGKISYCTYVIHYVTIFYVIFTFKLLFAQSMPKNLVAIIAYTLALAVTLGISLLSWELFEKRVYSLRKHWRSKKGA